MKQNIESAHARKLRQNRQRRSELALRFRAECGSLGLSAVGVAKLLHVTRRTAHNWFSGRVRPPYAALKLLRLMRYMELPGWDGWAFRSGKLYSPEGFAFEPKDSTWWALLVRQARCFRTAYAEASQLRAAARSAAIAAVEGAAGAGLVLVSTTHTRSAESSTGAASGEVPANGPIEVAA
jgi:DNA-binding transcriptional regulator YiaG